MKPDYVQPPGPFNTGFTYSYANKPIDEVTLADAARFANWLHNGQPVGPQNGQTTEDGAYTITTPTARLERNPGARFAIPSEDEWYKAAYFDPTTATYFTYPTRSNTPPDNAPPALDTGNSANVYRPGSPFGDHSTGTYSYPSTGVGAYTLTTSPFGVYDMAGNVSEWTLGDAPWRGVVRGGGAYADYPEYNASSFRGPSSSLFGGTGLRIAAVPEPSSLACAAALVVGLSRRRSPD